MTLSIIVACTENYVIGANNSMPWHLPADLKHFKSLTTGHTIIMGRKTYESIGKPLPNRRNLVISRNSLFKADGVEIFSSLESAIENSREEDECFLIGGGELYKKAIVFADRIYLTRIHTNLEGDTFFPEINLDKWKLSSESFLAKDDKNSYDLNFQLYEKIS
ncbi:MAG: dihydrofolate reductase [Leptospiraceae bacterium]|nr:dihydrofolate reductase [Leptospiraceae bacterium]